MNKDFWRATAIRALRTFLQVVLAMWTTGQLLTDLDFKAILISAVSAAVYSVLTSVATGLPEVNVCHEMTDEEAEDFIDANDEILDDLYEYETEENEFDYEYDEEGEA